ncbi:MAG: hypothetical protein AABY80_01070 [Candidatus Deferrimicrobiota bacterium]
MNNPRQSSRDLGRRSFGSFGNRPFPRAAAGKIFRKPKTGRICNYPFRRDVEEK